jgi:ParB/Sulfiredoxin domain
LVRGSKSAEREAEKAAEGIIAQVAKDALREADDDVAEAVERDAARSAGRDAAEHAARPDGLVHPSELQRTHEIGGNASSRRVIEIRDSLQREGWKGEPISIVEHDGKKYIVDGHHRVAAARRAGVEEVPYRVVELPFRGYRTMDDVLELPPPDNLRYKGKRF